MPGKDLPDGRRVISSFGHILTVDADNSRMLWCHPLSHELRQTITSTHAWYQKYTTGHMCGKVDPHCEATIYLNESWGAEVVHQPFTLVPLTIAVTSACLRCSACGIHTYVIKDVVYDVYDSHREGWEQLYKALRELAAEHPDVEQLRHYRY